MTQPASAVASNEAAASNEAVATAPFPDASGREAVHRIAVVMFGGTGDLARRKLLPALFRLWQQKRLRESVIVAVGRRCDDRADYLKFLRDSVDVAAEQPDDWTRFEEVLQYHQGEIRTDDDFRSLSEAVGTLERDHGLSNNRLFYYAVGPRWFTEITAGLSRVGLLPHADGAEAGAWARIVVEKPFGTDLDSAIALDEALHQYVSESQVFRIDHYLGKETVQNIMALRFANGIFEPIWNRHHIEQVQITVAESVGVGDRADYYDTSGATRDVMQNHMLQLLAITAMEPPISLGADALRDEKVKVLRSVRLPQDLGQVQRSTVRAQYGPGRIDGHDVPGYRQEQGVAPGSTTETYVATRVFCDTWRWANVPFYLRHGKRMPKKGTEIAIQFRTPPLALFRDTDVCGQCENLLILRIQPDEGISLQFGAKVPGSGMSIGLVRMNFDYQTGFRQPIPEAYERLLLDAMLGDATLFTRSDEVRASWRWTDAILKKWAEIPRKVLNTYPAGSWGPPAAESLFPQGDEVAAGQCPISWRRW